MTQEIVEEKNFNLNIGGGKRKGGDTEDNDDSFIEPTPVHFQSSRQILLFSERKHKSIQDLYLDDNHVNGLICGVAAFVGRKSIRKVAFLSSFFCTKLAVNPNADPVAHMEVYKYDYDILLAPIAFDGHWYLTAFYVDEKIVTVMDSLHYPIPPIFWVLKTSIESILHIQFTLKNVQDTLTIQQNGYNCGVHNFRNAEEICFHGQCKLFIPFHEEAERARAREILRKLKDKEIEDEWVHHVQNPTDFVDLNKPSDAVQEVLIASDNDSDIEI
uniref:Ubiquitin-like protease family profile domain-containing protein n=1 Tax=Panagrolaimus sp. ES5 TaxID=591445 RepID=A0AC34GBQ1_9BILA